MRSTFFWQSFCGLCSTSSPLITTTFFMQIYVWSMKTGRLLDVLSGHQGPVHGLMFSPISVSPCFDVFWFSFLVVRTYTLFLEQMDFVSSHKEIVLKLLYYWFYVFFKFTERVTSLCLVGYFGFIIVGQDRSSLGCI